MGNTWVSNMLHALDDDGNFAMPHGPARSLAMYMGSMVEAVTQRPLDQRDDPVTAIQCRRRPGHVRCIAPIVAAYAEDDPTTIVWGCPACNDAGYISGWQETLWDKRKLYRAGTAAHESPLLSHPCNCLSQAHESVACLTFSRIGHWFRYPAKPAHPRPVVMAVSKRCEFLVFPVGCRHCGPRPAYHHLS